METDIDKHYSKLIEPSLNAIAKVANKHSMKIAFIDFEADGTHAPHLKHLTLIGNNIDWSIAIHPPR